MSLRSLKGPKRTNRRSLWLWKWKLSFPSLFLRHAVTPERVTNYFYKLLIALLWPWIKLNIVAWISDIPSSRILLSTINQSKLLPSFRMVTSLDGINGWSIQTLLRGVYDTKECLNFRLLKNWTVGVGSRVVWLLKETNSFLWDLYWQNKADKLKTYIFFCLGQFRIFEP